MRGRHTSLVITLTPEERVQLLAWQRATRLPLGQQQRGRALLLLADGLPIVTVARRVGRSRLCIYRWTKRFLAEGVAGLYTRQGRRPARERAIIVGKETVWTMNP
jgi:Helix-turn-helix domain